MRLQAPGQAARRALGRGGAGEERAGSSCSQGTSHQVLYIYTVKVLKKITLENFPINPDINKSRIVRPPSSPATTVPQPRLPGGVRAVRPATPRTRLPAPRAATPRQGTPRGGARAGTPFPIRMLGQSSVSIERVPRPPAPPPKQVQQRTQQAAAIINQLQRYR